jgi:hypothetical protein
MTTACSIYRYLGPFILDFGSYILTAGMYL